MKKFTHEMFERISLDPDGWFICMITHDQGLQTKQGDLQLEIPAKIAPMASAGVPLCLYFMRVNAVKPCDFEPDKGPSWFVKTSLGWAWVFENHQNPIVSSRSDAVDFVYHKIESLFGKYDARNIAQMVDLNLSVHGILP